MDITDAQTPAQIQRCIEAKVEGICETDLVKVELVGSVSPDTPLALSVLSSAFENRFWFFKIKNKNFISERKNTMKKVTFVGDIMIEPPVLKAA